MGRFKDADWNLPENRSGGIETWDAVKVAVLMDIRDELKRLNAAIYCPNFMRVPEHLRQISKNTTKRSYKRRVK